ncbi:MAG: FecR domain-containing protein [Opitutaceae bacterium]|nr:FecR domain-containing protein [Opitutaceae bacterium]
MNTARARQDEVGGGAGRVRARAIEDAAANWLVRRQAGFSGADEVEFCRWLTTDPRHRAAFASVEAAWDTLSHPRRVGCAEVALGELRRRGRRRARRKAWAAGLAGLAAAIALLIALAPARIFPPARLAPVVVESRPTPTTVVIHPDTRHLPDGSVVELNAGAEITWDFSGAERIVRLAGGEALFTVAKDASHPFVVVAGGVKVWAMGTVFNVSRRADSVDVLVTEGTVKVELPDHGRAAVSPAPPALALPLAISEGERATISLAAGAAAPRVTRVNAVEVHQLLAWHTKRIEFTGTPLSEVVELFNRENRLQLSIGDASISNLQITGVYWADDPEGFIRLLKSGLDLKAERKNDHFVLRAP